jgi:hypothetical protein
VILFHFVQPKPVLSSAGFLFGQVEPETDEKMTYCDLPIALAVEPIAVSPWRVQMAPTAGANGGANCNGATQMTGYFKLFVSHFCSQVP